MANRHQCSECNWSNIKEQSKQRNEQAYNPATDDQYSQQSDDLLRLHHATKKNKNVPTTTPRILSTFDSPSQLVRIMQRATKAAQINADKSIIVRWKNRTVCTAELATAARSCPSCGKIENHRLSASSDSNRVVQKVQCLIERKVNDVRPSCNELKKRVHRPR